MSLYLEIRQLAKKRMTKLDMEPRPLQDDEEV